MLVLPLCLGPYISVVNVHRPSEFSLNISERAPNYFGGEFLNVCINAVKVRSKF
jgi:hypothetical protein